LRNVPALFAIALGWAPLVSTAPQFSEPQEILERTFRRGSPDGLRRLVAKDEKIRVASASLGLEPGYYSTDQICLVMQEVFRARVTVRFSFLKAAESPPEIPRRVAVARWVYRKGTSRDVTAQIAFTLIRRNGGWFLKEIRDVP
jgi:hypothetical protein